jgi:hypothetical protein
VSAPQGLLTLPTTTFGTQKAVKRATYILRRLPDIVDKMLDARRRGRLEGGWAPAAGSVDVNNIDMYPFFTYHVKVRSIPLPTSSSWLTRTHAQDLYNKFVERTATALAAKSMDEFYGTRTIFWEYTEYADTKLPMDRSDADETRRYARNHLPLCPRTASSVLVCVRRSQDKYLHPGLWIRSPRSCSPA